MSILSSLSAEIPVRLQGTHVIQFFSVRALAIKHQRSKLFAFRKTMWSRFVLPRACNRAPALLNCSPSGKQCDPDFFGSGARAQASVLLTRPSSSNQCDPNFVFVLLRAGINLFAFREPSPPNFFPIGGELVRRSDHFWARSRAELNQCDLDFSVRVLRSSMGGINSLAFYLPSSIGLLKLNFRNAITLELHERACWPEFYMDYAFCALALETCFFCVFFSLHIFFWGGGSRLSVQI